MTTRPKRTGHPADGLYYTTIARLREEVPDWHFESLRRDLKRYGEETPIPITKSLIRRLRMSRCSLIFRLPIATMRQLDLVTEEEEGAFWEKYRSVVRASDEAHAFMDMLLSRAKREGRA